MGDNAKNAIILCFRDKAFKEVERKKTTNEIQSWIYIGAVGRISQDHWQLAKYLGKDLWCEQRYSLVKLPGSIEHFKDALMYGEGDTITLN